MEENKKRPAKRKNKGTTEIDQLLEATQGVHAKRMNALLHTMDDEDFVVSFFKMAEYALPKLQRREVSVESKETTIVIEHITTDLKNHSADEGTV